MVAVRVNTGKKRNGIEELLREYFRIKNTEKRLIKRLKIFLKKEIKGGKTSN